MCTDSSISIDPSGMGTMGVEPFGIGKSEL